MEPTAPSVPMVAVFVMVVFWALAFLCCGLVCSVASRFVFAWIDTHIWPGDVHFCPTPGFVSLWCRQYCTGFCTRLLSLSSLLVSHTGPSLWALSATSEEKKSSDSDRQNGRGYSGGILVADYNQSPKRGVDCGIRAPAFWSDTWRWSNYFEYYTTGPMEVKFNLTLGSTWLWLYPSTTVLRLFRLRSFSSILRSSPGALLSTNRTAEFRFYDSSRFRKKAGDAKFRFYHVFRVGKVYRI